MSDHHESNSYTCTCEGDRQIHTQQDLNPSGKGAFSPSNPILTPYSYLGRACHQIGCCCQEIRRISKICSMRLSMPVFLLILTWCVVSLILLECVL